MSEVISKNFVNIDPLLRQVKEIILEGCGMSVGVSVSVSVSVLCLDRD